MHPSARIHPGARSISQMLAQPFTGRPSEERKASQLSTENGPFDTDEIERRAFEALSFYGDGVSPLFAIYVIAEQLRILSSFLGAEIGFEDPIEAVARVGM